VTENEVARSLVSDKETGVDSLKTPVQMIQWQKKLVLHTACIDGTLYSSLM